jgi:D-glycero-D-manno-heptose 1,7-bisphosphate phosphatase
MSRTALFVEIPDVLIAADPAVLLPGAGAALARLHQRSVLVVAITDRLVLAAEGFPAFSAALKATVAAAGGELAGVYAALPDRPASWRKPRPGMLLTAARELSLELPACWLIGTEAGDARAAAQAGCAGAVLIGGVEPPQEDLGIVVASARDLADAPRVMIPRQGGCWHDSASRG